MKDLGMLMAWVQAQRWAMEPRYAARAYEALVRRAGGIRLSAAEIQEAVGAEASAAAARRASKPQPGSVGVLPLCGVICNRSRDLDASSDMTSSESFARDFRALLDDPKVGSILIDVDSPGGTVSGTPEVADLVFQSRGRKPIVASANALAASAAYWIGSAADEFVVTPSGEVGSIGVVLTHEDWSKALEEAGVKVTLIRAGKHKVEGNPYEPLGDEAKERFQALVDDTHRDFIAAVARNRGTSRKKVREEWGQGRVLSSKEALSLGMVDRVETMDATIDRMLRGEAKSREPLSAAAQLVIDAEDRREAAAPAAPSPTAEASALAGSAEAFALAAAARRGRSA